MTNEMAYEAPALAEAGDFTEVTLGVPNSWGFDFWNKCLFWCDKP